MITLSYALFVMAALLSVSGLAAVARVGQERKPLSAADATGIVVLNAGMAVLCVLAGLRLL